MSETRLLTDDVGHRRRPRHNERPLRDSKPKTRSGERSPINQTRSRPPVYISVDDESVAIEIERLLRELQAGRRPLGGSQVRQPQTFHPISRSHSWGHGWGRKGATHRWGTFD